jgi:proteasome lid subunit RPN8/RPN11
MAETFSFDVRVLALIAKHAAANPTIEAGGFLGGGPGQGNFHTHVASVLPATNVSENPEFCFEADLGDSIAADDAFFRVGMELVGGFHTHPIGDAQPSAADLRTAELRGLELILALEHWEWKVWAPALSPQAIPWFVVS